MNPLELAQEVADQNELPLGSVSPVYAELAAMTLSPHGVSENAAPDVPSEITTQTAAIAERAEQQRLIDEWLAESRALIPADQTERFIARCLLELSELQPNLAEIQRAADYIYSVIAKVEDGSEDQRITNMWVVCKFAPRFLAVGRADVSRDCLQHLASEPNIQRNARQSLIRKAIELGRYRFCCLDV